MRQMPGRHRDRLMLWQPRLRLAWLMLRLVLSCLLGGAAGFGAVSTASAQAAPAQQAAPQQTAVPVLQARVTDQTGTLDAPTRQKLEQRLATLEQRKGAQVVILIVGSTAPDTIEQYATRVFDQWKLGRKNVDDGVLLIVAKDDHTLRIEVGYGLEGAIPDAIASRIIREQIVPRFKSGDYAGGIEAGVTAIEHLIDGEPLPAPAAQADEDEPSWPALAIFAVILVMFPAPITGIGVGAIVGLIMGSLWWGLGAGVAAFFVSLVLGLTGFKRIVGRSGRGGGFGGGFGGGGFGGGGGGFSGGGGSSGGGGASGRW